MPFLLLRNATVSAAEHEACAERKREIKMEKKEEALSFPLTLFQGVWNSCASACSVGRSRGDARFLAHRFFRSAVPLKPSPASGGRLEGGKDTRCGDAGAETAAATGGDRRLPC